MLLKTFKILDPNLSNFEKKKFLGRGLAVMDLGESSSSTLLYSTLQPRYGGPSKICLRKLRYFCIWYNFCQCSEVGKAFFKLAWWIILLRRQVKPDAQCRGSFCQQHLHHPSPLLPPPYDKMGAYQNHLHWCVFRAQEGISILHPKLTWSLSALQIK